MEGGETWDGVRGFPDDGVDRGTTPHLEAIVEASPDPILALDTDGTVQLWNEAAQGLFGYTAAEVMGEPIESLELHGETDRREFRDRFDRALSGETFTDLEVTRRTKDGTRVHLALSTAPVRDADGTITGIMAVVRDVTHRTRREQELATMADRVDVALDATDAVLWEWDPNADTAIDVYPSTASLFGREIESYEAFRELIHPDDRSRVDATIEAALESESAYSMEFRAEHDGECRWFCTAGRVFRDEQAEQTRVIGVSTDVTERKRREARLAGLDELTRASLGADSPEAIGDVVVDGAEELLDMPVALVARYDDEGNALRRVAATAAAESGLAVPSLLAQDGPGWRTFVGDEPRRLPAYADCIASDCGPVGIWPLGSYGIIVGSTDETEGAVADAFGATVAATVQTALENGEYIQLLEEREARLTELTDRHEGLHRINEVIRRVDRALIGASTRSGIEAAVCAELARFEPYRFVVTSGYDRVEETVVPRKACGDGRGYLEGDTFDSGPWVLAAESGEPQAVQELLADPPLELWRDAGLAREFGSCLALPMAYGDSLYGVLTVFGDRPGLFDETERAVLGELADNVAQAINAVESKKSLVGDRVIELEFTTTDEDVPIVALATATGGTVELEDVVPRQAGGLRGFCTVRDADEADIRTHVRQSVAVEDYRTVAEHGEGILFSCHLTDESVVSHLVDHGVVPLELTAEPGAGRLVVELSPDADVREFVETLEARWPAMELTDKTERERSRRTRRGFRAVVEESLTDRQLEVLQTAFDSGYFESPRTSTGSDVADSLGISQPTFTDHLRTAHRKLMTAFFAESPADLDR